MATVGWTSIFACTVIMWASISITIPLLILTHEMARQTFCFTTKEMRRLWIGPRRLDWTWITTGTALRAPGATTTMTVFRTSMWPTTLAGTVFAAMMAEENSPLSRQKQVSRMSGRG